MAITIKDIARAAAVSHTTVSRALHDNPAISSETIIRIKDLAIKMGYVPNATARGLKTHRSRSLGIIVSNVDDPFWSEVMHGVDDILHPAGYSFFVAATHRDKQREKDIVQLMVQRGVDGVILLAPQFSAEQSQLLRDYGLPMVIVNNEGAGEYQYLIYNDDIYGIGLITRHLIELGHQNIAFLGNKSGGRTNSERERGFREEMNAGGLIIRPEFFYQASSGIPEGGEEGGQYLLSLQNRPTAIICYNDYMAMGVYKCLRQTGLRIPQDISVTGFDDIKISDFLSPPLTTLHQFKNKLGGGAATMMLEILESSQDLYATILSPKKVVVQGELVIRKSTAPPVQTAQ
jgi:DNA-binding LacI/PurR family transcriptional regulator